ncbi:MAG: thermonuclease family protein [Devosiaceae bacterium]|nr:thermonuclease family protein [Devosiaceae bacterium MH13]
MRSTDGFLTWGVAILVVGFVAGWLFLQTEDAERVARGPALERLLDRVLGPEGFDYEGPVPLCRAGDFETCVIDGDSVLFRGEQLRLERIDAPEIRDAQCEGEQIAGLQARDRLSVLLTDTPFRVVRFEEDRYGRTLARLRTEEGWISSRLVEEGLAQWWDTSRGWC